MDISLFPNATENQYNNILSLDFAFLAPTGALEDTEW